MRRKVRTTLSLIFAAALLLAVASLNGFNRAISSDNHPVSSLSFASGRSNNNNNPSHKLSYAIREDFSSRQSLRHVSSVVAESIAADSVLVPDWQVLVVVSPDSVLFPDDEYSCVFQNNDSSPARPAGVLPFTNRTTFLCELPNSVRRLRPFFQPALTRASAKAAENLTPSRELIRWNFLAYESFSTANDVVLFAKGVNNRQGINRSPAELSCVFSSDSGVTVRTPVTTTAQEVFRCLHPPDDAIPISRDDRITISIEIVEENRILPSLAHYAPGRNLAIRKEKSLFCACTMVYNVAKFLKEWVKYHSSIGIDKFILYDNGSDDDLQKVIDELQEEGYNTRSLLWPWSKTQEAGFSHCALLAKDSCTWMIFIDVDEFIFSPSWLDSSQPSKLMLKSLLPKNNSITASSISSSSSPSVSSLRPVGEISLYCYDFGPSGQRSHPVEGVTQGYTCRRRAEERHKSMVLLEAVDESLLNVIHHFRVKQGYRVKKVRKEVAVVNHYKYQAWPEFKAKFRRRVSAYVVDWRQEVNPASKDRTPGLGFRPVEPAGWADRFCEVKDEGLKILTQRWFGVPRESWYEMPWQ